MTQTSNQRPAAARSAHYRLFVVTALLEAFAGLGLLCVPGLAVALVFGLQDPALEALVVARVGGAALLALGVGCWLVRDDHGRPAQRRLLWIILLYNLQASAVLSFAGAVLRMVGFALWPIVLLHALMAIWCAVNVRVSGWGWPQR